MRFVRANKIIVRFQTQKPNPVPPKWKIRAIGAFAEDPIMMEFAPKGYSDYQNRIDFAAVARTQITIFKTSGFEVEINFQDIEK